MIKRTANTFGLVLALAAGQLLFSFSCHAQKQVLSKRIKISLREVTIDSALNHISYKTNVFFSYNSNIIDSRQRFTFSYEDAHIEEVMDELLVGTGVSYSVVNGQIILFKKHESNATPYIFEKISIRGNVRNAKDGEPIPGINVYVAGTLKGSSTDINGNFEISELVPGKYEIVFSHVVYEIITTSVTVSGDRRFVHLPVKMNQRTHQLKEIEIIANSEEQKNWQQGYKKFKEEFFGKSQNAGKCKILNAEVLNIDYNKKTNELTATADQPLIIENLALGYRINYVLELFENTSTVTRLLGVANFEELPIGTNTERKRVLKNRKKSYEGSMTHFLRSLSSDRLKKEGFIIDEINELPTVVNNSYFELPAKLHVDRDQFAFDNKLKFTKYLLVIYKMEYESSAYVFEQMQLTNSNPSHISGYLSGVNRNIGQLSFIKLNIPSVTINAQGYFNEPLAVTTYGYWSWERVAEYMPFDYDP